MQTLSNFAIGEYMKFLVKNGWGLGVCLLIAIPACALGSMFTVVGGPVFAILMGMAVALVLGEKTMGRINTGVGFTSEYVLQAAVVFLGFGLNLAVIAQVGIDSLPIIAVTISASLIIAFIACRVLRIPGKVPILIGVGSSICGGSAIAATAPVVKANDEEVAQAISVIFLYNVIAAILFPLMGQTLGFSTTSGDAFGLFSGTAVNDTSSVTAAAATWDSMFALGTQTLDAAVTVKLTRTLVIIPITLVLAFWMARQQKGQGNAFSLKRAFPLFILWFLAASLLTTVSMAAGIPEEAFAPFKELAKFLIILAMAGIGLKTNVVKLVKTGGKPLFLGLLCWVGIIFASLAMMHALGML